MGRASAVSLFLCSLRYVFLKPLRYIIIATLKKAGKRVVRLNAFHGTVN